MSMMLPVDHSITMANGAGATTAFACTILASLPRRRRFLAQFRRWRRAAGGLLSALDATTGATRGYCLRPLQDGELGTQARIGASRLRYGILRLRCASLRMPDLSGIPYGCRAGNQRPGAKSCPATSPTRRGRRFRCGSGPAFGENRSRDMRSSRLRPGA